MKLIAIETATDICSIAYFENGICRGIIEDVIPRQHAEKLPLFYNDLVSQTNLKLSETDAIAVSIGPGSFTGLRIGLSYAKGLAYSHQKPIVPVPTMRSLYYGSGTNDSDVIIMMHSYGNKYFIQNFNNTNKSLTFDKVQVFELNGGCDIKDLILDSTIIHYGCDKLFYNTDKNIRIIELQPSSRWIGELAHNNFHDWMVKKPYQLVPEYVSPFNIGN